jgi:hypothetical protein
LTGSFDDPYLVLRGHLPSGTQKPGMLNTIDVSSGGIIRIRLRKVNRHLSH